MTTQDDEAIAQRIEDGSYFDDAREWYSLVYIGPISQRIFFIIVTCVAALIFVMSLISILNLLPIKPRIPFVYRADDIMNEHPRMERFKGPGEESNPALIKYFLRTYVEMRESYDSRRYLMYRAFTKNYSAPNLFAAYDRETSTNNPRSPIRRFGRFADVKVDVQSVTFNRAQVPFSANVQFSTSTVGKDSRTKSDWTATITFEYTDLTERNTYDEASDDYILDFDEPTFRVLSYQKRERLVSTR